MIRAIHIEDEPGNVRLVEGLVNEVCSDMVILVGSAGNVDDAADLIQKKEPDLIYLDIELNRGNAFELIKKVWPLKFEIIFITAFHEYAVKAFRCNALDYLLKPISIGEFKEATQRAIEKIKQKKHTDNNLLDVIKDLYHNLNVKKVGFNVAEGMMFVNIDKIIKIEANGSYSKIYIIGEKTLTCVKNLKEIENQLPSDIFIRVHHSWIINLHFLKKYYKSKNGYMEMEDGSTVPVSVRKKGQFLNFF